jgi:hypothetical protein
MAIFNTFWARNKARMLVLEEKMKNYRDDFKISNFEIATLKKCSFAGL